MERTAPEGVGKGARAMETSEHDHSVRMLRDRGVGALAQGTREQDLGGPMTVAGEPAAATMVLTVGYLGTDFSGFAEQPHQGLRTVAGELRCALETYLRRPVTLTCAGRTDAGVHGLGQRVSVPVVASELELSGRRVQRALEALTPRDISIRGVGRADAAFSARFSAISRSYRYRIVSGPRPVLMAGRCWWHRQPLDVGAMDQAARLLEGEHDFRSFCKVSSAVGRTTMRHLDRCRVSAGEELGEGLIQVDVVGNAFLHNMVRIIVGSLAEVGMHRREPSWMAEVLRARDRRAAGPTAPPEGLEFMTVDYPEGSILPWE